MVRVAGCLIVLALAASCSREEPAAPAEQRNPVVTQALDDPLMTDPDLSSRNEGAAAITVRTDGPLPALPVSPDAVGSARAEAAAMIGGEDKMAAVPPATGTVPALKTDHSLSDHLALLADKTACKAPLRDSTIWAARLPQALPVYPRGATIAATGGEGTGCRVIALQFATPVPLPEVLAFYWQRARAAGLAPVRRSAGDASVLQGQGKGTAFDLRARSEGGQTLVELATVSDTR
jgi:hypothetical protein